jgi:alpha-glucosidase
MSLGSIIYGVDFKSGINTQTYKYYIDFASKYGIEYIILDEGWYKLGNLLEVVPEMNSVRGGPSTIFFHYDH